MILRFQLSWEIRKIEENAIELSSILNDKKYVIKTEVGSIFLFLNLLKQGIDYPEDVTKIAEKLNLKVNSLHSLIYKLKFYGILIQTDKSQNEPLDTIYDRQIRFFRTFESQSLSGEKLNENLQNSTVLIVGLGGYGSWTALLCARMGIRNIIGVDFDTVEITNLHRQILFDRGDLGILKVKACEKKLKEADPDINFMGMSLKVESAEELIPLMDNIDLVFNPFSYLPRVKALNHPAGMIAQAAMAKGIPCLTFGGSWIGPLTIPKQSPCYFCAISTLEKSSRFDPELRNQNIQKRAFAPPIAACCSIAVYEASRYLSGCDSSQVLNGIIQLDMFSFSNSQYLPLKNNSECNFCNLSKKNNFRLSL